MKIRDGPLSEQTSKKSVPTSGPLRRMGRTAGGPGAPRKQRVFSTALEPSRTQDGHGLQYAQTDSSFLRPHRICGTDAQPHRGPEELVRELPAAQHRGGQADPVGPAGGLPRRVPDQGLRRARQPGIREVRVRGAQVRRRGMPAARHHLRRSAQGHAAARRVGHRRGSGLALDPRYQGAGRLHGRHAAHDRQRHLHRQRHRARDREPDAPLAGRLLRPRQGQDPFLGQVPVRRPHHPLSRLVARLRVRRQGPDPRPHRPSPQDPGDDAAARARQRRDLEEARGCRRQGPDARSDRGPGHVAGGDPGGVLRPGRLQAREGRLEHAVRRRIRCAA